MHGVRPAGQVMSAEAWRQGRKQRNQSTGKAQTQKIKRKMISPCHKDCDKKQARSGRVISLQVLL
jgi:hypothetical protein